MVPRCHIVLVHGTFAFDEFDDVPSVNAHATGDTDGRSPTWWQNGSEFAGFLGNTLGNACASVPVKESYSVLTDLRPWWKRCFGRLARQVPPAQFHDARVFHWSGENSESVRREAGERLLAHLVQVNDECKNDSIFHVIAHSHAGNVLWEALRLASHRPNQLSRLGRWITVATPYLRFRWDRAAFITTLVLVLLLAVTLYPFPHPFAARTVSPWQWFGFAGTPCDWIQDYWSRFDAVSTHSGGGNFALAVLLSCTLVMVSCLTGRALWETYCYEKSREVKPGDRRRIEFSDMVWGWTLLLVAMLIIGFGWLVCWAVLRGSVLELLHTSWGIVFSQRGLGGLAASAITAVTVTHPR